MATRRKFNFERLRDLHSQIGELIAQADATAQPIEASDSMEPRGMDEAPRSRVSMSEAIPDTDRLLKNR